MKTENVVNSVLDKYSIKIENDGFVFCKDKDKTLTNIFMDTMGMAYQVGTYLYDTPKEERNGGRNDIARHMSGEVRLLTKILSTQGYFARFN